MKDSSTNHVPRLFQLFDLVTVVNLPERTDRLQQVRRQLRQVGAEISGSIELFPAIRPAMAEGFPTVGAHGCFRNHLGCIERALAVGAGNLLILEDDVDFAPRFATLQAAVAGQLECEHWDIFYGGGLPYWPPDLNPESSITGPGLRLVPPNVPIMGAHFVGFNRERLQELREYLSTMLTRPRGHADGGPMDVDGAYSWFRKHIAARTLMADPELGHQRSSASDIRPSWHDSVPVARTLTSLFRRVRRAADRS